MRKTSPHRPGVVAVLVAISLVAIVSVMAIALDASLLLDKRRNAQATADAAAMAAAVDLFSQYRQGSDGLDSSGLARASGLSNAAANGYANDGVTSIVTMNIPPTSGVAQGKAGYAEVTVQYNQRRAFSGIFGSGDLPVQARAVACGVPGDIGILILDPHLTVAAQIVGNINIINNGQIYCNSNSSVLNDEFKGYGTVGGVYLESTCNLTCGGINVVGSLTKESGGVVSYTNNGSLKTGGSIWSDPLAYIPEPVPSGTNFGNKSYSGAATMQPGIYDAITINSNASVTMQPGIYYISSSGSIVVGSGATLTGAGVMIYNQSGDKLNFKAAAAVNLTPPISGTYQGISIFQPRSETKEVHIESGHDLTISGTLYAQAGEFDLRPNGATTVFHCGNYICDQAEWAQGYSSSKGKSNGTIIMNANTAAATQRPRLVE